MQGVGSFLLGLFSGGSMIGLVTAGLLLLRAITIVPGAADADPRHLLYTSPLFMLVIVSIEELVFRHLLVGGISRWGSLFLAISASVLVDFVLHIPNGSQSLLTFVNSALFSIVASLFYLRHGLAAAIGFHWSWNLVQWTILGYPMYERAVGRWLHVVPTGASWLTGGSYGPENSLLAGLALTLGIGLLVMKR